MRRVAFLLICSLFIQSCAAGCRQTNGVFEFEDDQSSARLEIQKDHLSFESGLSDGIAPIAASHIPYVCSSGIISFSFSDQYGNAGKGTLSFMDGEAILNVEPASIDATDFSATQARRNYGTYHLRRVRNVP